MEPPWRSNYTININLPENYWLAEKSGLPEMHEPLMTFIGHAARKGAVTARDFFGTRGWAMCHNSDIWAMTHPAGNYGDGRPCWVNWYLGGVWLSTHLWEHYRYTLDTAFLRERGYPLMKGAVDFCMDWEVKDREGYWITSPSTSPENTYITDTGFRGATLYGATGDLAMIRELMGAYIEASELLGCDSAYREKVRVVMEHLRPYRIGQRGNLQEWYHDWEDAEPTHRHTTHLFGLFPGSQISPARTPELGEAAVSHPVGVMQTNDDNARLSAKAFGKDGNSLYTACMYNTPAGSKTGGDSHAAADIICYMNGYGDPRREKYFTKAQFTGDNAPEYVGLRRGIAIPALSTVGLLYSGVNFVEGMSTPLQWMNAAEVFFLRAEAAGVFGWEVGGDAKSQPL